jgi:hypothetical protein
MQGLFNLYLSLLFCLLRMPSPSLSTSLCFRVESASRRHVRCIFGPVFLFPLCMCLTKVTYCESACFLFFFFGLYHVPSLLPLLSSGFVFMCTLMLCSSTLTFFVTCLIHLLPLAYMISLFRNVSTLFSSFADNTKCL